MRLTATKTSAVAGIVLCFSSVSSAELMDFDGLAPGTVFGSVNPESNPGDIVFSQDGIIMSIEDYFFNGIPGFFKAEVDGRIADFFDTTALELNNISVRFDFALLPFDVDLVTVEYVELGGRANLAANDGPIHELASLQLAHATVVAPGVAATVGDGLLTLIGDIHSVRIGGQELGIDNVTAVPEPAAMALLGFAGVFLLARRKICASRGSRHVRTRDTDNR